MKRLGTLGILITAGWMLLAPQGMDGISSMPNPARSYSESLERITQFEESRPAATNLLCRTILMSHGEKTEKVVILVHGYTSCPMQFRELGNLLYQEGCNVLIAPLPRHGLEDRMNQEHAGLKAGELADYADTVVDIAEGLGDDIVMMGISAGGVVTAWAAQHREAIGQAIIISPAFGFKAIPVPLTAAAMNFYSIMPDEMTWWNQDLETAATPNYSYPRYSRRALTEILRLGFEVRKLSHDHPPAARHLTVVLNDNDDKVSNPMTWKIVNQWKKHNASLDTLLFQATLNLPHDIVNPDIPGENTQAVFPRLIRATCSTDD